MNRFRESLKWLLFPGLNLHARLRYRRLPVFFGQAAPGDERRFLDAGCGNGMLTYAAYQRGFRARGLSIKADEAARCRSLFNNYLGIPETHLRFEVRNLYELDEADGSYDQIVCSEVLEHLRDDRLVLRKFYERLHPGGVLHLCVPNAEHPDHKARILDAAESGGHVRPGYTVEELRQMLKSLGMTITDCAGLGGPLRQFFNKRIIAMERRAGFAVASLIFLCAQPFLQMDSKNPRIPYSIYMRATKP